MIQAAFDAGGLDAICALFAKLEATITELHIALAKLQARANGKKFIDPAHRARLQKPYDDSAAIRLKAHPEQHKPPNKQGKLGRVKLSTETNLLRRLRDKREEVLRFMDDLQVPSPTTKPEPSDTA